MVESERMAVTGQNDVESAISPPRWEFLFKIPNDTLCMKMHG